MAVASGQPGENIALNRVDDIGMILRAINQSGLNLRSLVDDVAGQVGGVRNASTEIANGNLDLSSRTEEAASSLEQTAASMEQMTATVKNNADTAQQAAQLAGSASEAAARGGVVVGEVVGTMNAITASSKRISDIIGVIDGIALPDQYLGVERCCRGRPGG